MSEVMEKEEAHKLIDRMPQGATWDDLMREIYVREAIERGLADSNAGRTREVREVRAKYGLPE
jgi:predicted transcriptional regulator